MRSLRFYDVPRLNKKGSVPPAGGESQLFLFPDFRRMLRDTFRQDAKVPVYPEGTKEKRTALLQKLLRL